ncbi:sensor histidine kinase [Mucilaginibacter terrenus]|uniref:histidine kinase n=1 Tax=Mucilaginibacter terrenus TaxID=2482727 RepID=A0A3E2NU02_9SPHI|nr:sensor histidine kinase [Mucilaginibacter terrenus]
MPGKYVFAYRNYYTYRNLLSVRTASLVFFALNAVIRILYHVFPESLTKAENFPEFSSTNWIFIIVTPIFYLLSYLAIESFKATKRGTTAMALLVFVFSLYIIMCGMYSSFITTGDPSNALTLYLVALSMVSVLFVFEYYETILLLVSVELMFTILLFHAGAGATEMTYNQMISAILLSGFYLTSRYFFSYKASYYGQIVEIREKTAEIEKANQFKNEVLGMVAHDLRNPIAAVESLAMVMEMEDIDEETQENLTLMRQSCVKARTIIDDLLEAAKNENAGLDTKRTDMNAFLKNIANGWKVQLGGKDTVVFKSEAPEVFAKINHEKFPRVIDNLISNALKFSKENDSVELALNVIKNRVVIRVTDHGMGIPKEMLPRLFERFSGAGRTGLRGEQSTGIGLSIVKQIVESHQGKINVKSIEGKGSIFTIELPVVA